MTDLAALLPRVARLPDRLDAPAGVPFDRKNAHAARWSSAAGKRGGGAPWRFARDWAGRR